MMSRKLAAASFLLLVASLLVATALRKEESEISEEGEDLHVEDKNDGLSLKSSFVPNVDTTMNVTLGSKWEGYPCSEYNNNCGYCVAEENSDDGPDCVYHKPTGKCRALKQEYAQSENWLKYRECNKPKGTPGNFVNGNFVPASSSTGGVCCGCDMSNNNGMIQASPSSRVVYAVKCTVGCRSTNYIELGSSKSKCGRIEAEVRRQLENSAQRSAPTTQGHSTPATQEDPNCPESKCMTLEAAKRICYKSRKDSGLSTDYVWTMSSQYEGQCNCGIDHYGLQFVPKPCIPRCEAVCQANVRPATFEELGPWLEVRNGACEKHDRYGWGVKYKHSDTRGSYELACGSCSYYCTPSCLDFCPDIPKSTLCRESGGFMGTDVKWVVRDEYQQACGGCFGDCPSRAS